MQERDDDFSPYPTIGKLPDGVTADERRTFAVSLIAEQGDKFGDYLFVAMRVVTDHEEQGRWLDMIEFI